MGTWRCPATSVTFQDRSAILKSKNASFWILAALAHDMPLNEIKNCLLQHALLHEAGNTDHAIWFDFTARCSPQCGKLVIEERKQHLAFAAHLLRDTAEIRQNLPLLPFLCEYQLRHRVPVAISCLRAIHVERAIRIDHNRRHFVVSCRLSPCAGAYEDKPDSAVCIEATRPGCCSCKPAHPGWAKMCHSHANCNYHRTFHCQARRSKRYLCVLYFLNRNHLFFEMAFSVYIPCSIFGTDLDVLRKVPENYLFIATNQPIKINTTLPQAWE